MRVAQSRCRVALVALILALVLPTLPVLPLPAASAATVPAGFSEETVFSGLTDPTAVRFAPDGRVFVAEKSGLIKVFPNLATNTPTVFADLRTNVYNFWDRGLLGLALDPNFATNPYVYVLYTHDALIGGTAPKWGAPGVDSDPCPSPPGPTTDGCLASGRLSRLRANGNSAGPEQVLIEDWCQQFPSHSVGSLAFGPDGALYASAGDGASFTIVDAGQQGNPCGDPPQEGGALRSQDLRTSGDPVGLNGTIIRVDPATGAALPTNPLYGNSDPNARRIISYGLRNPFRITTRPGTNELWLGDVGWSDYEEINRIPNPTDATVENFGWPCYEGYGRQSGYDAANLPICETLYTQPSAVTQPFFAYRHSDKVVPGESCSVGSSSLSGVAFTFSTGGAYPAEYQGALFFADYSRNCVWVIKRGTNGQLDLGTLGTFIGGAANPVELQFSPDGELFYVDFNGGTIRRIRYSAGGPPTSCPSGQWLGEYFYYQDLTGRIHAACESTLNYDWGAGGPASPADVGTEQFSARWTGRHSFNADNYTFTARANDGVRLSLDGTVIIDQWRDTAAAQTYQATRTLTAGEHEVKVEFYENTGDAAIQVSWQRAVANTAPVPQITAPAAGTTWRVGTPITFAGTATDAEQGTLPATALSWALIMHHCPSNCHSHAVQSWAGVAGGSFAAPDHEYPSYLELRLTATDAAGLAATASRQLDPQTATLNFQSSPVGLQLDVDGVVGVAPFARTVIVGSQHSVSAPTPQTLGGNSYTFGSWSDGGAQTHTITATAGSATYTATYSSPPTGCPSGQWLGEYFYYQDLTGRIHAACEASLSYDWGAGGPPSPADVGTEQFSARWTGRHAFAAGNYTFTARADDGVRVYFDGALIIDQWQDRATAQTFQATRAVTAGNHDIKVEYYENTGNAAIQVSWQQVQAATTLAVADLDRSTSSTQTTWKAIVTTTVRDNTGKLIANARVTGNWGGGLTGTGACTTNSLGQCAITSAAIPKAQASVTFTITGITHATLTYRAANNADPDGDSNGTVITVTKP